MKSDLQNVKTDIPSVLIVDDDPLIHSNFELQFAAKVGVWSISYARDLKDAYDKLSKDLFHVILLDKDLGRPGTQKYENGIKAIPEILSLQPHLQVLVFTGSRNVRDCVDAMKLGARNYFTKETEPALLIAQIDKAIQGADALIQKTRMERGMSPEPLMNLVGRSNAIRSLRSKLQMVGGSNRPVLLVGETGTGKTTAAKLVHEYRKKRLGRSGIPFIALNMAAIPSTLAERELFGHEKGSFTGAVESKPGFFELANGGTLFLDEIGETSLDLQAKLLKVLDDGRFFRVGGTKELRSSFYLICATNKDLEKMVEEKKFREDLYMRLATLKVILPSLSERKVDIPDIVKSLLDRVCRDNSVFLKFKDLPSDFIEYLSSDRITGNIRGIEQVLSQLLVFSPRDEFGTPQLRNWRATLNVPSHGFLSDGSPSPITLEELRSRSLDVLSSDFPGLKQLESEISRMIIDRALKQFPTYLDAAKALKIAKATLSYRFGGPERKNSIKNRNEEGL